MFTAGDTHLGAGTIIGLAMMRTFNELTAHAIADGLDKRAVKSAMTWSMTWEEYLRRVSAIH